MFLVVTVSAKPGRCSPKDESPTRGRHIGSRPDGRPANTSKPNTWGCHIADKPGGAGCL